MSETGYATYNMVLRSRGVMARYVVDAPPAGEGYYLSLANLEEVEEDGLATRLGTTLITKTGTVPNPLPGPVHSLQKLPSLAGLAYRYGGSGTGLYRRQTLAPGPYIQISSGLSGNPWGSAVYAPAISSYPYLYIGDSNGVIKDNGTLAAPQKASMLQPQYPVQAQAQSPTSIVLDNYQASSGTYTYTGISGGTIVAPVATTLTSAVTAIGINAVSVAAPTQIGLFQLLTIDTAGNQEVVLVIQVTATGFVAKFAKTHLTGVAVGNKALQVTVPASTTAEISKSFAGTPISAWPTTLDQSDYIGLYLFVSDPAQIQKIVLIFDCGDGSFTSDYFYKVIGQGPLQTLLDTNTDSSTSGADVVLSDTLGLFTSGAQGITQINTGLNQFTPLLLQLSDFAGAGRADFNDPVFNWQNVNGYQIQIVTNNNSSATVELAALFLFGGAGPDSFAGVSYDWLFTFYNANDGSESNPCMVMTDVNPPNGTNRLYPRRQACLLTATFPTLDPQATHLRWYRRGGTLADNYRRLDQVPITGSPQTYLDIWADSEIQGADTVSFTNDVPVTSSLPVPVATSLNAVINTLNQVVSVFPVSMANISVSQQVDLGNVAATNFEVVIVLTIAPDHFTAFVQNNHAIGETVAATAAYAQPVTILAVAFDQQWYAGDLNNPSYLYYSEKSNPVAVGSASFIQIGIPSIAITAIVPTRTNLFVSTIKKWWSIAPGSNQPGSSPTPYPTATDHGAVGPYAWCLKDGLIYFLAQDGIRVFSGSEAPYASQVIEFVWQNVGTTPIPIANPAFFANARVSWWNRFVFFSYVAMDGLRHRIILDTENKRFRNDDLDCQSLFLEDDVNPNVLVFGDTAGLIHQDRQSVAYDEGITAGVVAEIPISGTLLTPYSDQGEPAIQKNYNEFTLDANTNGQPVTVTMLFNNGTPLVLGTISTNVRARVNLSINEGDGFQAYKCAMQLTFSGTQRVFIYQAKIRAIPLAETRQSLDTYHMDLSEPGSKAAKNLWIDYNASAPIICSVYYDDAEIPGFLFTLPAYFGVRNSFRQRLPAIKFRLIRLVMDSDGNDFQVWNTSAWEAKPLRQGAGYERIPLLSVEK
jgi:hypothetical protein